MRRMFWVYGTEHCPYCHEAKLLLQREGHTVIYIDVSGKREWCDPEWKTVPQIFEVGKHIGGYEDLVAYLGG